MTAGVIALALVAAALLWGRRGVSRRSGMADYFLAGRSLSLPFFVATLVPTFYGGVLGIGEFTWRRGLCNWIVMAAPYYAFSAVYAEFLAGRVRLKPGLTIPDHVESAYGRGAALWSAGLVILLAIPADEILMCGALASFVFGIGMKWAQITCAAAAFALLRRGGLRADARANAAQFVLMFSGFAVLLPFLWIKLGGAAFLIRSLPSGHLRFFGGMGAERLLAWWLIALWTIVDPSFHQRCAAAEDSRTAKNGILISILFWAAFDAMTTAAGLYARAALPDLENPIMAFPALARAVLPPAARGLFFAALASSILAGLQGKALIAAAAAGKDIWGRARSGLGAGASDARDEIFSAWALAAVLAASCALSLLVPSVIGLWYDVGSAAIPGLLWPMVGIYFPAARVGARQAMTASAMGFCASLLWLLASVRGGVFFGIEPMFPGLVLATAVWWIPKTYRIWAKPG
ncbi:MAG: sodium:solute symporter family protein [Elusimicrobiota bacterium]